MLMQDAVYKLLPNLIKDSFIISYFIGVLLLIFFIHNYSSALALNLALKNLLAPSKKTLFPIIDL